ncbi:MAG: beta-ketoacyl-ACP synthase III [Candidatus Eutrophobiaceae bacterium]
MKPRARIISTGSYLPEKILHNRDLEQMVSTSDEWIAARTGIRKRHIAADTESCCDLAEHAARNVLEHSALPATSIDLLIVATTTPDQIYPSIACRVQHRLGMKHGPAFDLQAACSGFIYGLGVAEQFIRAGNARRIMVIGAETMSRTLDWSDRYTCILFGDGAGAAIVDASEKHGLLVCSMCADGQHADLLYTPGAIGRAATENSPPYAVMNGREVFKIAVRTMVQNALDSLQKCGLKPSDIDWMVPHQANIRIVSAIANALELPMEKVVCTVEEHGNTSAASIPLALDVAVRDGRIQAGQIVLLLAFGAGFTWASAVFRW